MITEEDARNLLMDVISINSMNPSMTEEGVGENQLAEYLGTYFQKLGLEVSYQQTEGRKNIIAVLQGAGNGKSLILNAHTDTVGREGMENPFTPEIKEGRIYGRGAYDMKGGLVSILLAIKELVTSGKRLTGDLIFAGVVDEEYASIGTEALVADYSADAAILCEPTDMRVVIANKGFSWIKMTVFGKASHGSKPHLGIDAIDQARKVMNAFHQMQQEFNKNKHQYVGTPAIRISKIEGGLGLSTVADQCTLYIERRTLPHMKQQDVQKELEDVIQQLKSEDSDFDAEFEFIIFRGGLELSEDELIVKVLKSNHQEITKSVPEISGEPWWMDSALMGEHGIPTVVIGPTGDGAHAKIEYVEINSVVTLANILEKTVIEFCGSS